MEKQYKFKRWEEDLIVLGVPSFGYAKIAKRLKRSSMSIRSKYHYLLDNSVEKFEVPKDFFRRIKKQAKNRNLQFDITYEYANNVFINQNRLCALSKMPIKFYVWNGDYCICYKKTNASLDRKDNFKGYVAGNIQWVDRTVNLMKRDMTDQKFIELCKKVAKANAKSS